MKTKFVLSLLFLLPLISCTNDDSSVIASSNTSNVSVSDSLNESIKVEMHYTVKFLNYDNKLLQEVDVLEGEPLFIQQFQKKTGDRLFGFKS